MQMLHVEHRGKLHTGDILNLVTAHDDNKFLYMIYFI